MVKDRFQNEEAILAAAKEAEVKAYDAAIADGATIPSGGYGDCTFPGDITLSGTFYIFNDCISAVARIPAAHFANPKSKPSCHLRLNIIRNLLI